MALTGRDNANPLLNAPSVRKLFSAPLLGEAMLQKKLPDRGFRLQAISSVLNRIASREEGFTRGHSDQVKASQGVPLGRRSRRVVRNAGQELALEVDIYLVEAFLILLVKSGFMRQGRGALVVYGRGRFFFEQVLNAKSANKREGSGKNEPKTYNCSQS